MFNQLPCPAISCFHVSWSRGLNIYTICLVSWSGTKYLSAKPAMIVQMEKRLLWHPRRENTFVVGGGSQITLYQWVPQTSRIVHITSQQDLSLMKVCHSILCVIRALPSLTANSCTRMFWIVLCLVSGSVFLRSYGCWVQHW